MSVLLAIASVKMTISAFQSNEAGRNFEPFNLLPFLIIGWNGPPTSRTSSKCCHLPLRPSGETLRHHTLTLTPLRIPYCLELHEMNSINLCSETTDSIIARSAASSVPGVKGSHTPRNIPSVRNGISAAAWWASFNAYWTVSGIWYEPTMGLARLLR